MVSENIYCYNRPFDFKKVNLSVLEKFGDDSKNENDKMTIIQTARIILHPWREEDFAPLAQINADPSVMKYSLKTMSRSESDWSVYQMRLHFERFGWGFFAASLKETNELIGLIGLENVSFKAPFTPAVEIGWKLGYQYWGKGYATEGAQAILKYGFEVLNLKEIVSFTAEQNMPSRAVMERIGMHRDPKDDFDDEEFPEDHWLRRHVLYRLKKVEWEEQQREKKS